MLIPPYSTARPLNQLIKTTDTLILAQLSDHLSDILFDLSVYDLSPVFRCEYDMIFTFPLRSVYKELHADHETGAADNK